MPPALVNFPALDLAFSRLGTATVAAACINNLSGLAHLSAITPTVPALKIPPMAVPNLGLASVFDRQPLWQTPIVDRIGVVPRPMSLDVAPSPPPLADPDLCDELDAMRAEIYELQEQVKARPNREVVVKGFGHGA